jgi:hypothetical protein
MSGFHEHAAHVRERTLSGTLARVDRLLGRARDLSDRFTRWRLAIFVTGALLCVALFHYRAFHLGNAALVLFVALFFVVARYHTRLEERMHRLRLWRRIKQAQLARLQLDWSQIPARSGSIPDDHPYAADLDLFGLHSLFHLLDTTRSVNGRERLHGWFLNQPPAFEHWRRRKALIQELSRLPLFRDRLALEASLIDETELDGARIRAALATPAGFPGLGPILIVEGLLAAATLTLGLWSVIGSIPEYWTIPLTLYAALYLLTSKQTAEVFGRALSLHGELNKLGAMLSYLERRSYRSTPALAALCAPLTSCQTRPSVFIHRLARVANALSVRAHPLVHLALNILIPWDLFFTYRLERLRRAVLSELPAWLEVLAELEAASALGNFAYLNPEYHWPTILSFQAGNGIPASMAARSIGHPLIAGPKRVTNDFDLRGIGHVLLVTGSNMSGKSTFLRTLGINVCLAQAGAPVCAASFESTWVRLFCCIRVDDSLDAGLSFFYAEVKRLKRLLDAANDRSSPAVLFLIDEIFKGTNNRERLIGSRAYISALCGSNGFGLVTTHDLELTEMETQLACVTNAHFQESVEANELRFDYRLRPGPCPTTNALRIMSLEGLPVPERLS